MVKSWQNFDPIQSTLFCTWTLKTFRCQPNLNHACEKYTIKPTSQYTIHFFFFFHLKGFCYRLHFAEEVKIKITKKVLPTHSGQNPCSSLSIHFPFTSSFHSEVLKTFDLSKKRTWKLSQVISLQTRLFGSGTFICVLFATLQILQPPWVWRA